MTLAASRADTPSLSPLPSAAPPPLELRIGAAVVFRGQTYHITHVMDFVHVMGQHQASGSYRRLPIRELQAQPEHDRPAPDPQHALELVADEDWQVAEARLAAIRPLLALDRGGRSKAAVKARAEEVGKNVVTLYRWIKTYEAAGRLSALLPRPRKDIGKSRLEPQVEALIREVVQQHYLSAQRLSVQKVAQKVLDACKARNLPPPHPTTVRNRIVALHQYTRLENRYGRKAAEQASDPNEGGFPGADWPLAAVQIDHTPLDIIVLSEGDRRPIGRPWFTCALDVHSRMVVGFYLGLEAPSDLSVGLCLTQAILPKDTLLARFDIPKPWDCWGLPDKLHLDNAREFHSKTLERACLEYGIDLDWRPVQTPHYGGHIERLMGTFSKELHALPGTTFGSVAERGDYDSAAQATMTLSELEKWLMVMICQLYHHTPHSALGVPPAVQYARGILGEGDTLGRGHPPLPPSPLKLRLDFLPYELRTVQDYGIVWDHIHYFDDRIRRWINAADPQDPQKRQRFVCRRDPRDLSVLYFYDPEQREYLEVAYASKQRPSITLWELRAARRLLQEEQRQSYSEGDLFEARERLRKLEESTRAETVQVRRKRAAKQRHAESPSPRVPAPSLSPVPTPAEDEWEGPAVVPPGAGLRSTSELTPYADLRVQRP